MVRVRLAGALITAVALVVLGLVLGRAGRRGRADGGHRLRHQPEQPADAPVRPGHVRRDRRCWWRCTTAPAPAPPSTPEPSSPRSPTGTASSSSIPSATRSGHCFDVSSPQALRRDGGSDPVGIMSMVRYVQQRYGADPAPGLRHRRLLRRHDDQRPARRLSRRVQGRGGVHGGALRLLRHHRRLRAGTAPAPTAQISKTPQQWGDLVGPRTPDTPARGRACSCGTAPRTPRCATRTSEEIKQWTNVLGLSQTPPSPTPRSPAGPAPVTAAPGRMAPVEAISMPGVGHTLPPSGMAERAIRFFGLDRTAPQPAADPRPAPPPTPTPPEHPAGIGCCRITYTVNAWNTGLTATITITNTGAARSTAGRWGSRCPPGRPSPRAGTPPTPRQRGGDRPQRLPTTGRSPPGIDRHRLPGHPHRQHRQPASFTLNGVACTVGLTACPTPSPSRRATGVACVRHPDMASEPSTKWLSPARTDLVWP